MRLAHTRNGEPESKMYICKNAVKMRPAYKRSLAVFASAVSDNQPFFASHFRGLFNFLFHSNNVSSIQINDALMLGRTF